MTLSAGRRDDRSMRSAFFICVLLVSACSKKKDEAPKASPGGSAATTPSGSAAATPTPTPAASKLDCEQIFAKELREKYFAGWEVTDNPQPVPFMAECKLKKGEDEASVDVGCHDNIAAAMQPSIDGLKGTLKGKDLAGVGKGAVIVEGGQIAGKAMPNQITAWDDNSNCNVHVSVLPSIDGTALVKDILATLPLK